MNATAQKRSTPSTLAALNLGKPDEALAERHRRRS